MAPLDFFSWHAYSTDPSAIAARCTEVRELLDKHGFVGTESILDEWNYVKGWTDEWLYSLEVQSGRLNQKGAAFTMATMIECQHRPVDMLMYYDARHSSNMNGLFDRTTLLPMKGYYPFYAWSKLAVGLHAHRATTSGNREVARAMPRTSRPPLRETAQYQ